MSEVITSEKIQADITHQYGRYMNESQERDERGKLTDVLAQLFEQRMNRALDDYSEMMQFTGSVLLLTEHAAAQGA